MTTSAVFAIFVGACWAAQAAAPPPASSAAAPETKPAEIAEKLKTAKESIVAADSESRRILGSLYAINKRMKKITREKSQLTDELFSAQGSAKGTARLIAALEGQIGEQKGALHRRLRALYKLSGQSYVAVLFSQTTPADLDQAMRGLKAVADRDYRLIRAYQRNVAAHKAQRRKLKSQVEKLVALEKRIRQQEGRLVAEHKAKTAVVSSLQAAKVAQIARVQTLRASVGGAGSGGLGDEKLESLLKPSFFESKGRLPAPVAGAVSRGFGVVLDEKTRAELSHKGWQIAAARGSAVSAVFDGAIAFSGWMPGYGNVVVIDHGDHYYSVYGHASKPRQKVGDAVKRGQTIAEVGATSWRDGDGAYFEIRHFSDAEDPAHWIQPKGALLTKAPERENERKRSESERKRSTATASDRPSGLANAAE